MTSIERRLIELEARTLPPPQVRIVHELLPLLPAGALAQEPTEAVWAAFEAEHGPEALTAAIDYIQRGKCETITYQSPKPKEER